MSEGDPLSMTKPSFGVVSALNLLYVKLSVKNNWWA